jgi:hypothetical protein
MADLPTTVRERFIWVPSQATFLGQARQSARLFCYDYYCRKRCAWMDDHSSLPGRISSWQPEENVWPAARRSFRWACRCCVGAAKHARAQLLLAVQVQLFEFTGLLCLHRISAFFFHVVFSRSTSVVYESIKVVLRSADHTTREKRKEWMEKRDSKKPRNKRQIRPLVAAAAAARKWRAATSRDRGPGTDPAVN